MAFEPFSETGKETEENMMKRVAWAGIVCLWILASGCTPASQHPNETGADGESVNTVAELKDGAETMERGYWIESSDMQIDDAYQVDEIVLSEEEMAYVKEHMAVIADACQEIYAQADKGTALNVVLEEETVHEMGEAAAAQGVAVTCANYDHNMWNYENVDRQLRAGESGQEAETEFYSITSNGYIKYFGLEFESGELVVTYGNGNFDENLGLNILQMEKFRVYDWEYTQKGWLIWEKALSQNQEMDMHSFFRILPLDDMCRELGNKYILPVGYFCNNLFLTDWDMESLDPIEFNDLYDFLYRMKYGESLDGEQAKEGIEKRNFEEVIQTFFNISAEDLEIYARYDSDLGVYPWEPIGALNRVPQFQPFPEVVKCTDNGDGTWTLYVEAIFVENGTDCSFKHAVTMKETEEGWKYMGNEVDEKGSESIPEYQPRYLF